MRAFCLSEGATVVGTHGTVSNVIHLDCGPNECFVLLHNEAFVVS